MDTIWNLSVFVAFIVFIVALVQGKGFWNSARMAVGVIVLGFVAMLVLALGAAVLKMAAGLLVLALWVAIIVGIIAVAVRVIKGSPEY